MTSVFLLVVAKGFEKPNYGDATFVLNCVTHTAKLKILIVLAFKYVDFVRLLSFHQNEPKP